MDYPYDLAVGVMPDYGDHREEDSTDILLGLTMERDKSALEVDYALGRVSEETYVAVSSYIGKYLGMMDRL